VRQGDDRAAIDPGHRLGGDQGVDDRLLGRLHRRLEQRVHPVQLQDLDPRIPTPELAADRSTLGR
jgi:hypothetical protein